MKKRGLYRLISLAVGDADDEDVEFGRGNELPESAADQGDGYDSPVGRRGYISVCRGLEFLRNCDFPPRGAWGIRIFLTFFTPFRAVLLYLARKLIIWLSG